MCLNSFVVRYLQFLKCLARRDCRDTDLILIEVAVYYCTYVSIIGNRMVHVFTSVLRVTFVYYAPELDFYDHKPFFLSVSGQFNCVFGEVTTTFVYLCHAFLVGRRLRNG